MTILSKETLKAFGKKVNVGSDQLSKVNSEMIKPQKVHYVGGI